MGCVPIRRYTVALPSNAVQDSSARGVVDAGHPFEPLIAGRAEKVGALRLR